MQEPELTSPTTFETNLGHPLIHASPPILSTIPNTRINPIEVGDDLGVHVQLMRMQLVEKVIGGMRVVIGEDWVNLEGTCQHYGQKTHLLKRLETQDPSLWVQVEHERLNHSHSHSHTLQLEFSSDMNSSLFQ